MCVPVNIPVALATLHASRIQEDHELSIIYCWHAWQPHMALLEKKFSALISSTTLLHFGCSHGVLSV